MHRLPGDEIKIGILQRGLHLFHKIRKFLRHGAADDTLGRVDAGGNMQAHLLPPVFLPKYTNVAHSSSDQPGGSTNKADTALVYYNQLIAY